MLLQLTMITKDLPNNNTMAIKQQLKQLTSEVSKNKVKLIQITTVINLQH